MSRTRVAAVLGMVAVLALLASTGLAVATYVGHHDPKAPAAGSTPAPLVVSDPRSGATFEVPAAGWRVAGDDVRIYYADDAGAPVAVVRGPAVFRQGYCAEQADESNRGFAGFTRQGFDAWVRGLTQGRGTWTTRVEHTRVRLAEGGSARMTRLALLLPDPGPCASGGVEVAMVEARGVRLVLVRDTGDPGTLPDRAAERVLRSLRVR